MESLGEQLLRERERRNISLYEISRSTKIHLRYLNAIEHGQFDQLPGGVITKGFLRAYAEEIGADADMVVAEYLSAIHGTPQEDMRRWNPEVQEVHQKQRPGRHIPGWAFTGALILLSSLIVLWMYKKQWQQFPDVAQSSVDQPEHPAAQNGNAAAPDHRPSQVTAARSLVDRTAEVGPGVSLAALHNDSSTDDAVSSLAPGMFSVLIRVRRDAWISITADGKRMLYQTLAAPNETSVAAHHQVLIRVGNTGAVDFWFNGRQLPTQGEYDEAKTFIFDASGMKIVENYSSETISAEQ